MFDLDLTRLYCGAVGRAVVAGSLLLLPAVAQTPAVSAQTPSGGAFPQRAAAASPFRFQPSRHSQQVNEHYGLIWGVDSLSVKWAESGELVRFTYHVVDPEKAKALNDKKSEPSLIDPQAQVKLVVPSLEKVGQLRQSSTPIAGKSYWMAFSNRGRVVKRGDRVTVQIGNFRADGLVVE